MRKIIITFLLMITAIAAIAQDKTRIAIFDFKAGAGVENATVKSLSDILINSLFSTNHYTIVERSQIDNIIKEQGFQKSGMTDESSVAIGRVMNVKAIVLGTVVWFEGEYNIDIRLVDVESGELISTAGATKRPEDSFRSVMDKLSKQLDTHLYGYELSKKNNVEEEQSVYFYSIQNSAKWKKAKGICDMLNAQKYMGRNDWRLPTEYELQKILMNIRPLL